MIEPPQGAARNARSKERHGAVEVQGLWSEPVDATKLALGVDPAPPCIAKALLAQTSATVAPTDPNARNVRVTLMSVAPKKDPVQNPPEARSA